MPSFEELVLKAAETITAAHVYLDRRETQTTDAAERARIHQWRNALTEAAKLVPKTPPGVQQEAPFAFTVLAEQLDLTQKHIGELHEYFDFNNVDVVFRNLQHQVALVATHGPGAGNPAGGPRRGR